MLSSCRPQFRASTVAPCIMTWLLLVTLACLSVVVNAMTDGEVAALKQDARYIFYHGMTNYHRYAYPEDELRPITCQPLTRDRLNPAHVEVNDVLGNYSLSIVDSLSTLAILASSSTSDYDQYNALDDFQRYIRLLVEEYGDGTPGPSGQGKRARGFDLDSKVQVFETTIRGVGGLLSAHLFATGELPIRDYHPVQEVQQDGRYGILWSDGFVYDGQLLRLARDLGERLLPAFHTPTGLPYPRVNLRHGTPFYENSPLNNDAEHGQCTKNRLPKAEREITETCSAGAGSLVLEFTVLSRLTGDGQFERLAKRAFWAVWERRSSTGLLGAGIDAETGNWIGHFTGIGAGIDSFFEYAFKSHVLLSGSNYDPDRWHEDSPESFLQTWQDAYAALSKHIRRDFQFQYPHYAQNDLWTGGPRLSWIDSLSAYYPGLLALAGEIAEASEAHLLYTALWTRYGALPERWNAQTGAIDNGLRWWGGRPEFIESTWYLYRATQDPWYLHVGEMTLRDIKRRCWTKCGWAGLQDVRTGEQSDRMESFFLGETVKYLYLLFDADHPLNKLDAPWVFTTEGHPLIIPKEKRARSATPQKDTTHVYPWLSNGQCPVAPQPLPFTISSVAARPDIFHAASLARLHLMPKRDTPGSPLLDFSADHPSITLGDVSSPNNHTYFPWTLPPSLIPQNATSSKMAIRPTFDLSFPSLPTSNFDLGSLQKVDDGILINSISGLRFGMVLEEDELGEERYRIHALSNLALGKDESLFLGPNTLSQVNPADPHFTRMRDTEVIDLIIDAPPPLPTSVCSDDDDDEYDRLGGGFNESMELPSPFDVDFTLDLDPDMFSSERSSSDDSSEAILSQLPAAVFADADRLAEQLDSLIGILPGAVGVDNALRDAAAKLRTGQTFGETAGKNNAATFGEDEQTDDGLQRWTIPAILPTGIGAAPLPLTLDSTPDPTTLGLGRLPYGSILLLDTDLCSTRPLSLDIPSSFNILIIKRGGCSFSEKLSKIPSFAPSARGLQFVIVVSFPEHEISADFKGGGGGGGRMSGNHNVRPLLDEKQLTPKGVERRNGIAMGMVSGGQIVWDTFMRAATAVGGVNEEKRDQDGDDVELVVEYRVKAAMTEVESDALKCKPSDGNRRRKVTREEEEADSSSKGNRKKRDKGSKEKEKKKKFKDNDNESAGVGIRRRYYWSSQGIRISNLHMK